MKSDYISGQNSDNINMMISTNKRKIEDEEESLPVNKRACIHEIVQFCNKHEIDWIPIILEIQLKVDENGQPIMEY